MKTRYRLMAVLAAGMLAACGGDDDDGNGDPNATSNGDPNATSNGDPDATSNGDPNNANNQAAKWNMELSGDGLMANAEGNITFCCLAGLFQAGDDGNDADWSVPGLPSERDEIEATTYSPGAGSSFHFPGVARCVQSVGQMVTLTVTDVGPPTKGEFTATARCTDIDENSVVLSEAATVTGSFELD